MPVSPEFSPCSHSALPHIATQDFELESPTPPFEVEKPRGRSLSPKSTMSSVAPSSAVASSSKTMYSPPPLTWRTAFQDAKAGIHYTKDAFPSSNFLPPPFSREPVSVEAGDRVEVLEEVDDYAVRVRVLRTGAVGLIPLWNTEGALERLTRINTAFNEAATCPVEARALRRRDSESSAASWEDAGSPTDVSLSHIHARCIPYATRVRFPHYYGASSPFSDGDDDSDSDRPDSPESPADQERGRSPTVYEARSGTLEAGGISETASERSDSGRRKSVNFATAERPQVVFRYPSEDLVGAFLGEKPVGGDDVAESAEHDDEWWWQGWEEMCEEGQAQADGSAKEELSPVDEEDVYPFVFYEDEDDY